MNTLKYFLKIKQRIKKVEKIISEPITDINNPFLNIKPKTYVWVDEAEENFKIRRQNYE